MEYFYTVTQIVLPETGPIDLKKLRNGLIGIFLDLERAKEAVETDEGDIGECGFYNYCFISKMSFGIYPQLSVENRWFYKNVGKENEMGMFIDIWEECETPECVKEFNCLAF